MCIRDSAKAAAGDVKEILVFLRRMNISDWVLDTEESEALAAAQQDLTDDDDFFAWATGWLNESRDMTRYLMTEDMIREEITKTIVYLESYQTE